VENGNVASVTGRQRMTDREALKPCPCGKVPEKLIISEGNTYRWRQISGSCCGEWEIESQRIPYQATETEVYELCAETWNQATRATAQAQARIAELEAEVKRLHTGDNFKALLDEDSNTLMQTCLELHKTIKAKDERIAELEKDAERYRYIKNEIGNPTSEFSINVFAGVDFLSILTADELDDSIDKAMKGE
jgi:hypothetical protein